MRETPPHTQTMNIYACILSTHTHNILSAITHRHSLRAYPPSHTPTLRSTGTLRHMTQHTLEETSLLVTGNSIYTRRTTTIETSSLENRLHTHTHTHLTSDAPCLSPLSDGHKEPSYKQG